MLTTSDHNRDYAGFRYAYPVVSRRAGGVSVGINLNPNNACNWACIYCQVPDLARGGPPPIDLAQLERELCTLLEDVLRGDFMQREVPEEARQLMDVAFSGNGEPTSAEEFDAAVERVIAVMQRFDLSQKVKLRLITNGSLMHRPAVRSGIARIGLQQGEVWFKIDRGSAEGISMVNRISLEPLKARSNLELCCSLAPTWVQTCWFMLDGRAPDNDEEEAYLDLLRPVTKKIRGVHLYGLARPSLQPDAPRLGRLPPTHLAAFAARIASLGTEVNLSP